MPYSSVSDVPGNVPKDKRKQWLEVFNSVYARAKEDGDDAKEAERSAFAQANAVAGPNADKAQFSGKLAAALFALKAVGTKGTGFVRGTDGPFNCGHCRFMDAEGFCQEPDVVADVEAPHDDQGRVPVAKADCCNEYEPTTKAVEETEVEEKTMKTQPVGKNANAAPRFSKYIPFVKIDEARQEVWGIVTAEVPDKDNEVCDYEKSKPYYRAVIDEMSKATQGENFFPLREMHQLKAAGKCVGFEFRDQEKEIFMGFKVVDKDAWQKVSERVYTGFSQGGSIVGDVTPDPVYKGCMRYVADPSECSLVDNPALGIAHFTLIRADGSIEICKLRSEPLLPEIELRSRLEKVEAELSSLKAPKKVKRFDGVDLMADAFLIVGDKERPETWLLPVRSSDDGKRRRYVRRAFLTLPRLRGVDEQVRKAALLDLTKTGGYAEEAGVNPNREAQRYAQLLAFVRKRSRIFVNKNFKKVGKRAAFATLDDSLGRLQKMCVETACCPGMGGLGNVSALAGVIEQLTYVFYSVLNEQEWEQDDSALPELLSSNIGDIIDSLLAMVAEEGSELKDTVAARLTA